MNIEITNWKTILTDQSDLYFEQLIDKGTKLIMTVRNKEGNIFDIIFHNYGPYLVVDEQYRIQYWNKKKFKGWTFELTDSPLLQEFINEPMTEVLDKKWRHFVISTWDCILEVLSSNEPIIRRY